MIRWNPIDISYRELLADELDVDIGDDRFDRPVRVRLWPPFDDRERRRLRGECVSCSVERVV